MVEEGEKRKNAHHQLSFLNLVDWKGMVGKREINARLKVPCAARMELAPCRLQVNDRLRRRGGERRRGGREGRERGEERRERGEGEGRMCRALRGWNLHPLLRGRRRRRRRRRAQVNHLFPREQNRYSRG